MALTVHLTEADDALLAQRAQEQGRSKEDVAREAIHVHLTDEVRRLEDLEDAVAVARHELRKHRGEVSYIPTGEARRSLGLPPAAAKARKL